MTERAKYWATQLASWERSGLTQAEYCRRRRIKAGSFAWWKRQLLDPAGGQPTRLADRPTWGWSEVYFVRTAKESCLNRMIFFGEDSLRRAVNEFLAHYHHERNHQGLGNRLIDPREEVGATDGSVTCRERLGGLLRYYYRQAA